MCCGNERKKVKIKKKLGIIVTNQIFNFLKIIGNRLNISLLR